MHSLQVMMAFAASPTRGLIVFAVVVTFVWKASGQSPNTTLNPFPEPSSTQYPPDQPLSSPPSDLPSTTPGSITCCYIMSACQNCTEVYNVNSISYCCPDCRGMVLVTDLVCRCTLPVDYKVQNLKCQLSNKVVGGYQALRPSYYDVGGCGMIRASLALLSLTLMMTFTL